MKKQTVEERRTEILETTCEVVIERGFAATRIADVAKRLNVSTSLIHYHFDSKEQLLAEAFSHYANKDLAELDAEIESAPNSLVQLDRAIHSYVPEGSDDVEWMLWIDAWGEALRNPLMKRISQQLDEQSLHLLERVIAGGVSAGEFTCNDPAASALRLTGLIDGLAIQFAAHDDLLTRQAFIDHVRWLAAAEVGVAVGDFDNQLPSSNAVAMITPVTDLVLRQLLSRIAEAGDESPDQVATLCTADAAFDIDGQLTSGRAAIATTQAQRRGRYQWIVTTAQSTVFTMHDDGVIGARLLIEERFTTLEGQPGCRLSRVSDRYALTPSGWLLQSREMRTVGTH